LDASSICLRWMLLTVTFSLIYGEYLVNVHFSDIPHTFILDFTLHSAEKIRIRFSANYPLTTFRIPQNTPSRHFGPKTRFGSDVSVSRTLRTSDLTRLRQLATMLTWSSGHTVNSSQVNSSHMRLVTQSTDNRTLRTQDTSVPRHFGTSAKASRRHFGTGAEAPGQFGPKTLRHQDISPMISALVSGHFGTNAWTLRHYSRTPLTQCNLQGHSRSSLT